MMLDMVGSAFEDSPTIVQESYSHVSIEALSFRSPVTSIAISALMLGAPIFKDIFIVLTLFARS